MLKVKLGYLELHRYAMPKVNHAAFLEVGIRESHRGIGLATKRQNLLESNGSGFMLLLTILGRLFSP